MNGPAEHVNKPDARADEPNARVDGSDVRADGRWRRLDGRVIAAHCFWLVAPLASVGLTALATGGRSDPRAWITLGSIALTFAVLSANGLARWLRTRYRVTGEHFEVRSGLFVRRLRSVPLSRIRNVDLTANLVHRLLGLAVLRAGTADRDELRLEALSRQDAARLRGELLRRADTRESADPVLAMFDPRWVRYAPLTFWTIGGVFVVLGTAYRILNDIGIEPWRLGFLRDLAAGAVWVTIPLTFLAFLVVGSVGATALYAENWWNYRLEWADSGTLAVRRGLFTTRSVSMGRERLRGVLLREPLLLRAGGGAKVTAVASGLGDDEENRRRSSLLPPAPRAEALRVVERLTGKVADRPMLRHPRVALRRRVMRGLTLVVLPVAVAVAALGLPLVAGIFLVVATPIVWWLARDAYRNLGHAVDGDYLLARSGTFSRDTLALRRTGIVAWTFSSSPFGRRAGVVTLTAAVAAGEQGYRIPDLAAGDAPALAERAAPGILPEFLV
ncbi:PH domain-containing protein [Nonomuraea sp. NPDC050022]|uniref:PH domain-containing protein n=1 Tax=Nonomuraea sp. NPDC050022 TaxID=3364358 RepID=UPI0037AC9D71